MAAPACPFLDLPTELRLLIYNFVLLDSRTVTVGTAELTGAHPDIVHRLYGDGRQPLAGIPKNHVPAVEARYNAALLSLTQAATVPLSPSTSSPAAGAGEYNGATLALLLVCRRIRKELTSHFKPAQARTTSLFVQYPHGLHVCRTMAPHLLGQAKSIHLAGSYTPGAFSPQRAACVPGHQGAGASKQEHNGDVVPDSAAQLGDLIKNMFGAPPTTVPVALLEMRIYYPGDDSYSTVWGDDSSPVVIALRSTMAADIAIEVWRGMYGTGVYLCSRPVEDRKRSVSTVWRRLEEGRRGEPKCGSWVLDPLWPAWQDKYEMSSGPVGDVITSTPRE